jgi:hypothetical protein
MADAQVFKGGTPVIKYGWSKDDPILSRAPFGRYGYSETSPPFNAHYDGSAGQYTYAAGCPLKPNELAWQKTNLKYAKLDVNDVIQMIVVPTNHWIDMVRFDVNNHDDRLAGATVSITGQRLRVDPNDPYNKFLDPEEDPIFEAAATAQGVVPIPLATPSSTILWLSQISSATITGTIPPGTDAAGGVIDAGTATGFVQPLYVEPEFYADPAGTLKRHETGALILGIKIVCMPTNTAIGIADALYDFYLTTRVTTVNSPSFS